jgi:lipoate-protein ligase A
MHLLDLTLPTPEQNLALDDALLEQAERGERTAEVLRLWESPAPIVVLGRSSQVAVEVNQEACRLSGVPILRRSSGGAAIVAGPGCLMYALVLNLQLRSHLRAIDEAHAFVLDKLAAALSGHVPGVSHQGISDLAWLDRKFSGNSLRVKRDHILYHGTLLYDFPLPLIGQLLDSPPRHPAWRKSRRHDAFVANLPLTPSQLRSVLRDAWEAHQPLTHWPRELTSQLAAEKYLRAEWNLRH